MYSSTHTWGKLLFLQNKFKNTYISHLYLHSVAGAKFKWNEMKWNWNAIATAKWTEEGLFSILFIYFLSWGIVPGRPSPYYEGGYGYAPGKGSTPSTTRLSGTGARNTLLGVGSRPNQYSSNIPPNNSSNQSQTFIRHGSAGIFGGLRFPRNCRIMTCHINCKYKK